MPQARPRRLLREFVLQDVLALIYSGFLLGASLQGSGPRRVHCIVHTGLAWLVVLGSILLVRGRVVRRRAVAWAIYQVGIFTAVLGSYFRLRDVLPTTTDRRLDELLYQADLALFGFEPTLWLDAFVTPATTAWFAFFYWSYFVYLAVHIAPILLSRDRRLAGEFSLGLVGVYCIAQLGYFFLPGYGPYHHLAHLYVNPLPHSFFLDIVDEAVRTSGALLDIFPSLHTAGPLYIALFSFLNRDRRVFRYTWPVAMFCSVNIIGATLFLRWHYLVDVVVGIALAAAWAWLARPLHARDEARRRRTGAVTEGWPLLRPARPPRD